MAPGRRWYWLCQLQLPPEVVEAIRKEYEQKAAEEAARLEEQKVKAEAAAAKYEKKQKEVQVSCGSVCAQAQKKRSVFVQAHSSRGDESVECLGSINGFNILWWVRRCLCNRTRRL